MNKKWIYILLSLFVTFAIITFVFAILLLLPPKQAEETQMAVVDVIKAPTSTPFFAPTFAVTPTATLSSIEGILQGMEIGAYAQITGTSGDGLSIRSGPGKSYAINFIGMDSELFKVIDGPNEADGYIWWKVEAPYDSSRNGWCVQDYLGVVETPQE